VYAQRSGEQLHPSSDRLQAFVERERDAGVETRSFYLGFQEKTNALKDRFLSFLIEAKRAGKRVGAYGAAAKGNTLLNYAGVRADLVPYVVDRNPAKVGKVLPGSRIPIVDEHHLTQDQPDFVVVFPWNLIDELSEQLGYVRSWGGTLVTAVPELAFR
jgi:hypothetical protein